MAFLKLSPELNIPPHLIFWIAGGIITLVGTTVTSAVKLMTRGHITEKRSFEKFQTKEVCSLTVREIKSDLKEIKSDQKEMGRDIKAILKNGR